MNEVGEVDPSNVEALTADRMMDRRVLGIAKPKNTQAILNEKRLGDL